MSAAAESAHHSIYNNLIAPLPPFLEFKCFDELGNYFISIWLDGSNDR